MDAGTTVLLGFVSVQRLAEVVYAETNMRRLVAAGGREFGADHYPWMVGIHAVWLIGLWFLADGRPMSPIFLAIYLLLQVFRAWILVTLGRRWTIRVVVIPGEVLVAKGPYRFIRHPNYVVVAAEVACLPLVFGLWWYAALFTVLNAAILFVRINVENQALSQALRPA